MACQILPKIIYLKIIQWLPTDWSTESEHITLLAQHLYFFQKHDFFWEVSDSHSLQKDILPLRAGAWPKLGESEPSSGILRWRKLQDVKTQKLSTSMIPAK